MTKACAAGPYVAVSEREPAAGTVVLGRWKDGAVRVVEWVPKEKEGTRELGHRKGDVVMHSIYLAQTGSLGVVVGVKEWPIEWAELLPLEENLP